jgi:predicted PurR-regulated permease PerM
MELRRNEVLLWGARAVVLAGLVYVVWRYVGTVVLGLFVYYVTRPVFDRINARVPSRGLAVAVSLLAVALPVLLLVGWTVAVAVQSLSRLLDDGTGQFGGLVEQYVDVTALTEETVATLRELVADPGRLAELDLPPVLAQVGGYLTESLALAFGVGIHAFIVLIIAFYLLRDDHRIAAWTRATVATPDGIVDRYLTSVDTDLSNVFFGNILNALLTGLIAAVTYLLLNLVAPPVVRIPEAALVGLLVGAASLIPVVGIKLVTTPITLYLLFRAVVDDPAALWFPVLFAVVSFVVVDYIPDQLLRPYVSGRTLHVGAIMLAYTLGPLLFGWYGIFLGPLLLVLGFEFLRLVVPWLLEGGPSVVPAVADRDATLDGAADDGTTATDAPSGDGPPPGANGDEPTSDPDPDDPDPEGNEDPAPE